MPLRDEVRSMEFHQLIMTANLFNVLDSILSSVQIPHHVKPGGYPEEIFVNLSPEEKSNYECCICYNILKDAKQCVNLHRFCGSCIFVWTTSSVSEGSDRCPMCRAAGYYSSCHTYNYKLEIMRVKCQQENCDWEGYLKNYDEHEHKIYNIRREPPAPVLPLITSRKTPDRSATSSKSTPNEPAVPSPAVTSPPAITSPPAVPSPPSNPRQTVRDNTRLTARFQQARISTQNNSRPNASRASVRPPSRPTQNRNNAASDASRRNSVVTSRQNSTPNTRQQPARVNRGTATNATRFRAGHSLPPRRVSNLSAEQEPVVQSASTVVVVSETPLRDPTPEQPSGEPEAPQTRTTIVRESGVPGALPPVNNQSSESRVNILPSPSPRRVTGPRPSGTSGDSVNRTAARNSPVSTNASRTSSIPIRDTGINRVRGVDTNRLHQFQRINQQIRTGRQQLQAIMGILGGEVMHRHQALQDYESLNEERQRRRLEQLQEVNNLGRQLGEVASNLAMLLTGIQEVQREQQNTPD